MLSMSEWISKNPSTPATQELVDAAIELMNKIAKPGEWSGAAAMRLSDGSVVTSAAFDAPNDKVNLCHETGSLCEAEKRQLSVTGTVCVNRDPVGRIIYLPPCGICQERLFKYGPSVSAVVPSDDTWESKLLGELQPYYWGLIFVDEHSKN